MRLKQDVEIVIVDVDFGVGVIRRRANRNPLPTEWVDFLGVNPVSMLDFEQIRDHRNKLFRMISFDDMDMWLREEM